MKAKIIMLIILSISNFNAFAQKKHTKTSKMTQNESYMREAIHMAKISKNKGNLPYGCILVDKEGNVVLKGENTINTDHDMLAHAEINLLREASKIYSHADLNSFTIYTSDEPCPMCTSAIYWTGVGKLVYGLSKTEYYNIVGRNEPNWVFEMSAKEVLSKGNRQVDVVGPILENEAAKLHKSLNMNIRKNLKKKELELPQISEPGGNYVSVNIRGNIAYVAIQFPIVNGTYLYQGRLGDNATTIDGYKAMQLCALNVLAQVDILGEKGIHSRAIFGVEKLPRNFSVGLTASFTLKQ